MDARVVLPAEWLVWRQVALKYEGLAPREQRKRIARLYRLDPAMADAVRRMLWRAA